LKRQHSDEQLLKKLDIEVDPQNDLKTVDKVNLEVE